LGELALEACAGGSSENPLQPVQIAKNTPKTTKSKATRFLIHAKCKKKK